MARESTTKAPRKSARAPPKAKPRTKPGPKRKSRKEESEAEGEEGVDTGSGFDGNDAKEEKEYDSDALDDQSDAEPAKKRKRAPGKKPSSSPRKKSRRVEKESEEYQSDADDGQEVVGEIVQAPKTGRVPPGQVSQNTLNFLSRLKDPECNNREWFKMHEPVYRLAEKEWKDFVEAFTDAIIEVDPEVPPLPPKDVIHRIYRDIRFSNDKTPYKQGFSASFSRSGRKGTFAGYHIAIKPNNQSIIAAGAWCPGKNELSTIRANIQRNSTRLRDVISAPEFVEHFGEAKRQPKGERSNIFGMEDELKVAPKGIDKNHQDIDLLKCRSFAVVERFLDSEVVAPGFKERLAKVAAVMCPFVHCLNDMMSIIESSEDEDD